MRELLLAAAILIAAMTGAHAASFTPLGDLPGGSFSSQAYGVSADGSVVVGSGSTGRGSGTEAFRWTLQGGMVGLGDLYMDGYFSTASAVSADGRVVVGGSIGDGTLSEAFQWTLEDGMAGLGDLPGGVGSSNGIAVSGDGSTVVGVGAAADGNEPFRWTAESGMVGLGYLPGGIGPGPDPGVTATGVSADGTVVVGNTSSGTPGGGAFRWTAAGGMVALADLPGGPTLSNVFGVSADGRTIVGTRQGFLGYEAFAWTAESGTVDLGMLATGIFGGSGATAASGDGRVIVGAAGNGLNGDSEAFVWTEATGMARLYDVLVARGVTGLAGWALSDATGLSVDGKFVVGLGTNPLGEQEAFLANIAPVPIPAGVCLFGGALGLLGFARRR